MMVMVPFAEVMLTEGIVKSSLAVSGPLFVHFIQPIDAFFQRRRGRGSTFRIARI